MKARLTANLGREPTEEEFMAYKAKKLAKLAMRAAKEAAKPPPEALLAKRAAPSGDLPVDTATTSKRYRSAINESVDELLCPITQELMADPVITADGQTYERRAIAAWLNTKGTSVTISMCLSYCVTPSCKGYCLFIIHRHPCKCFSNVQCSYLRIRITINTLRVNIN
mgnify:CR=1 FL=1